MKQWPMKQWPMKRWPMARLWCVLAFAWVAIVGGCGARGPVNPSFVLDIDSARSDIKAMRLDRKTSVRPVVVIGGLLDPLNIASAQLGDRLTVMLSEESQPVVVGLVGANTMKACRERVVEMVQARWPSDDPSETLDVDVVGFSLGGVVGRDAAIAREGERRLKVVRMFTICSPHMGSGMAQIPTTDARVVAIRSDSEFLSRLDHERQEGRAAYELYCYTRLDDGIVAPELAAPRDLRPWWVTNLPLERSHGNAHKDARILADIARRLRDEPAYATMPPAPLPEP